MITADRPGVLERTTDRLRAAGCVFAEEEAQLMLTHATDERELAGWLARRVTGEPLEVVLGRMTFCGLTVLVDTGVFVPRRRTEWLVRQTVAVTRPGSVVVDLCCGTGAIGLVVSRDVPDIRLYACDIDPVAVRCATRNIGPLGGQTFCGDLFDPLPDALRGSVDSIVVNAPYVPTADVAKMPSEARDHEPRHTLDGGADGVEYHRRIGAAAGAWLRPGGHVLLETGAAQAALTAEALSEHGLLTSVASSEELSATVVTGRQRGR
ncbi:putative protein N(5)-glutamine methyltransferase [Gordonia sp. HNM0687]|uniref:peptide chain release factor N(5)-glutamine methyltransferase n=1 Tax=Gordonia mangrovi TaxID=2665643 RepID=A0A6L7GP73_9ACTN|nr:putative protein N(5)-glutamine methyltransferase [Gordonia mangrovi]MXP21031.1 putative protein N(5)-glutamine methyltransferase [Gordonia mangrovi]UVF78424.1 putative protein N(5)-glutamine methyltransferase [Gordonia mangrovi]